MKQSSRIITIPKPCHEDWDAMTPAQQGRHCAMCQKTVVDFTLMTDGQVLDVLKRVGSQPLCGHFTADQLDRTLVDTRYHPSFIKKVSIRTAAMLLLLQSATSSMFAQQAKTQATQQEQTDKSKPTGNEFLIKGRVLDIVTHLPVSGVRIWISGTDMDAVTDKDGAFTFVLPAAPKATIVLQQYPTEDNKNAVSSKALSVAEMKEDKEIVMYSRSEIKITYKKPMWQGYVVHTIPGSTATNRHQQNAEFEMQPPKSGRKRDSILSPAAQYAEPIPPQRKPTTFWQRMASPFRSKRHTNETD